jgi:hypothetical protein
MNDLIGYGIDNSKSFKIMEYVRKNKVGKPLKQEDIDEMQKARGARTISLRAAKRSAICFPRAHATAYVMGAVRVAWFKTLLSAGILCDVLHGPLRQIRYPSDDVAAWIKIVDEIHRLQEASKNTHGSVFTDRPWTKLGSTTDKDDEVLKTLDCSTVGDGGPGL